MRRIRLLFALLAVGLAVPVLLLAGRVLRGVELERSLRHRAVAERIVDEMERELTGLLRREEDRPYGHYRYFYLPDTTVAAGVASQGLGLSRSPLADPPRDDFIVGYFQVEPDGTLSSPLWPRNETLATKSGGWRPDDSVRGRISRTAEIVRDAWSQSGGGSGAAETPWIQSPGSTVEITSGPKRKKGAQLRQVKEDARALAKEAEQEILGGLNRGVESRRERASKISPSQAQNVYDFAREAEENVLQQALSRDDRSGEGSAPLSLAELSADIARTLDTDAAATVEVRLEPMVGRRAGDDRLLLYRTVQIQDAIYRQGLLVEAAPLLSWLTGKVLGEGALAGRVTVELATAAAAGSSAAYVYQHRFAEPFGSFAIRLGLATLPQPADTYYLYALVALLVTGTSLGLFSLYRMVATKVRFAERQSDFVSAVTHELKTPLTSIRMYGEMLRDDVVPSSDKRQQYFERITAESERLTRLVNNVLELGRLQRGDRPVHLELGDVRPLLHEAVALLEPNARNQGFRLRLEIDPDVGPATYDRDALQQVLFNLVDNSLKYAREAEDREVVVRCSRHADGGVALAVLDHGPGVARRHLRRIFEPFFRGENELTRTAKGTGIGLSLVRGLVERMGGRVSGGNAEGGGFEVRVLLAGGDGASPSAG